MILNMNGGGSGGVSADGGSTVLMKVASGESIKAGDFVKLNEGSWGTATVGSSTTYTGYFVKSMEIDSEHILVLYRSSYIYGVIYSISGTTMTAVSSAVKLVSGSGYNFECLKLRDGRFVLFEQNDTVLNCIMLSVANNTISVLYTTKLCDIAGASMGMHNSISNAVEYTNNRVAISYVTTDDCQYLMLLSFESQSSVSVLTTKQFVTQTTDTWRHNRGIALRGENELVMTYVVVDSIKYVYVVHIKINGTTITVGTPVQIAGSDRFGGTSAPILIGNNLVLVPYTSADSNSSYSHRVYYCYLSGSTLTKLSGYGSLNGGYTYGWEYKYFLPVSSDTTYYFDQVNNNLYLYPIYGGIVSTSITLASQATYLYALKMSDGRIVVTYSNSGNTDSLQYIIKSSPTISKCVGGGSYGIALTSGSGGDTIEVLIPN